MARLKLEWRHWQHLAQGAGLRDRLVAHLPRYAPLAARLSWLVNTPSWLPGAATLLERLTGLSAQRPLPRWRADVFRDHEIPGRDASGDRTPVILLADTFNRYFEPENLRAAVRVLDALSYAVEPARDAEGGRPLCCGRTYLAVGMVDEARAEARRLLRALQPAIERGLPVVGLEPSCLFTLRDEYRVLGLGAAADALAKRALTFEEFLSAEARSGKLKAAFQALPQPAVLHGHCHQKAFGAFEAVRDVLGLVPQLQVSVVESGCCGMAGSFGYEAEHVAVSRAMGELSLLPAVRASAEDALVIADGTSCRHQISDGTGRAALHVARVLELALPATA
jgi:Fe-S oxidoreductase